MNLRPLGPGELVDRAVVFWRAHWRALFMLTLPFQLVQYIAVKAGTLAARLAFPGASGDALAIQESMKQDPLNATLQIVGFGGVLMLAVLASWTISIVSGVAQSRFMYERVLGKPGPSTANCTTVALGRIGAVTGSVALSIAWSALIGLGLNSPGIILLIAAALVATGSPTLAAALGALGALALLAGMVVLLLWFLIRFVMQPQVIALEATGPLSTFRRCAELSSGRVDTGALGLVKVRLTVLITIVGAVMMMVSLLVSLPSLILGALYGAGLTAGHSIEQVVPQSLLVPVQVAQVVLGTLFVPIYEAFRVMFYVDMRVRRDGLDLALSLGRTT